MRNVLLFLALTICGAIAGTLTNATVNLSWNYPSNDLKLADDSGYPLNFVVYGAPVLTTNFVPVTDMIWTNFPIIGFDGTNYTFKTPYTMNLAGSYFFTASASNGFWGESAMSNTSSTPPLSVKLKLTLTP